MLNVVRTSPSHRILLHLNACCYYTVIALRSITNAGSAVLSVASICSFEASRSGEVFVFCLDCSTLPCSYSNIGPVRNSALDQVVDEGIGARYIADGNAHRQFVRNGSGCLDATDGLKQN